MGHPAAGRSMSRVPGSGRGVLSTGLGDWTFREDRELDILRGPVREGGSIHTSCTGRWHRGGQRKPWRLPGGGGRTERTLQGQRGAWPRQPGQLGEGHGPGAAGEGQGLSIVLPSARESGVRRKGQRREGEGTFVCPAVVAAGSFWKFPWQAEAGASFPEPQALVFPPSPWPPRHPGELPLAPALPSTQRPAPTAPHAALPPPP